MTHPRSRLMTECFLVWISLLVLLAIGSLGVGVTWDESIYFDFSDSIRRWVETERPLAPDTIERHWGYDPYLNPHPPFMKILDAVTASVLADVIMFPLHYRLGHFLYVSLALAFAFALLRAVLPLAWALAGVLFVVLQPRMFGELLIATTDAPTAMAWLVLPLIAWCLDASPGRRSRVALRVGLFVGYGFAVATKFTGLLVAMPLAAFFLYRRNFREAAWMGAAVAWGLLFLVVVSPEKWSSPTAAVADFLFYPFTRPSIPIATYYFGSSYPFYVPWHYFAVMSLITFPVELLVSLAGLPFCRREDRRMVVPLLFCVGFWLVLFHLPITPKHDGVRQFASIFPILGLLSVVGLRGLLQRLTPIAGPRTAAIVPGPIVALLAVRLWTIHPHELSFYNSLIGGVRGAEKAGMEMSYYFESVDLAFLRAMNRTLRPGDTVFPVPGGYEVLDLYQRKGFLRDDVIVLEGGTPVKPDYFLVLRRRANVDDAQYI
ncbi:MAG: hypothetical protein ACREA0_13995, partial [bacterium]